MPAGFDENRSVRVLLTVGGMTLTCYILGLSITLATQVMTQTATLIDFDLHTVQIVFNFFGAVCMIGATVALTSWGIGYIRLGTSKLHGRFWKRHGTKARRFVKFQLLGLAILIPAYIVMQILLSRLPSPM